MDLDVDRIIDSVGRGRSRGGPGESAARALLRWWVAERAAPVLLPFQGELLAAVLGDVQRLRDHVETTSLSLLDDGGEVGGRLGDVKIQLLLVETELERVKYVARAYIRTWLSKIDAFRYFYLRLQNEQTEQGLPGVLSRDEWIYCHRHAELRADLHLGAFLNKLPAEFQDLAEMSEQAAMIDEPDSDKPVVVRSRTSRTIPVGDEAVELATGSVYLLRFSAVADMLDEVELLG